MLFSTAVWLYTRAMLVSPLKKSTARLALLKKPTAWLIYKFLFH